MPEYHLARTKRSCQWTLVDNDQFQAARGLLLWKSSTNWNLEKQLELAKRLKMCPRVCDIIGGGKRICGKCPKRDANKRTFCGKCKIDVKIPTPTSGTPKKARLWETESSSSLPHVEAAPLARPRSPAVRPKTPTSTMGTQTDEHSMTKLQTNLWDPSYGDQTQANTKCCTKRLCKTLDLTMTSSRQEFAKSWENQEAIYQKIKTGADPHNTLGTARKILRLLGLGQTADFLTKRENEDFPKKHEATPLKQDDRKKIEKISQTIGANLQQAQPGAVLLETMQHRVLAIAPSSSAERAFMFDAMLGFFLPAARNQTLNFKISPTMPREREAIKNNPNNLVIVKKGNVIALYFGLLKMTTTERYKHNWTKRFLLTKQGIHTVDDGTRIPCHFNQDEWALWTSMLFQICQTQYEELGSRRKGSKLFSAKLGPMATTFWGVKFGSQLQRKIFRNGYARVDPFFLRYVMQHSVAVDEKDYIKPALLKGPWSTN